MKISKAVRFTFLFAIIGLLTTILVVYVQRNMVSTFSSNLALVKLGDHIKNQVTKTNLIIQQSADGKPEHISSLQVISSANVDLLQSVYNDKANSLGDFSFHKSDDVKVLIKTALEAAENVRLSVKKLGELNQLSLSQETEKENLVKHTQSLETAITSFIQFIHNKDKNDTAKLNTMSWFSIALVFVSFTLLCALIYRLQKQSQITAAMTAKKLREESERISHVSHFIEAVSAGNYDIDLSAENEDDNLISTLVNMKNKLKQNNEEDRRRNWSTTGEAQIGEILRANASNSSELYDNIIKFLVKYTKSNQGGLFIYSDEESDPYLELVACYAFERKKYLTKRLEPGDGLVGQCFIEGDRIYLEEVPQEYVSITSGLGGSNPKALLLVPLKVNDKIYGVLELASFNTFEEYQIKLVEKLAESIASTISSVRVNETTRILLEKTQQQAEEMKSQEEEIRQNMEELEATQEEMRRKQQILETELEQSTRQADVLKVQEKRLIQSQQTLQAIVDNIPRAIFWKDKDLRFMGCNKLFASAAGMNSTDELIGKTDFDMPWSSQAELYRKDDLEVMKSKTGKLDIEEMNVNSDGQHSWVRTSKVPIIAGSGEVVAILGMFEDITPQKHKEAEIAEKLREREEAYVQIEQLKKLLETKNP